jgi:viroplasmin and RNaseH domain-containing protein
MSKKKYKYYAVWNGRQTGIFTSWAECEPLVSSYPNNGFKGTNSLVKAKKLLQKGRLKNEERFNLIIKNTTESEEKQTFIKDNLENQINDEPF